MEIMAVTFSLKTILAHAVQKVIQTVQPFSQRQLIAANVLA